MRNIDFSSWQSVLVTLAGLTLVTLISLGIRLVMMMTVQQRRERMNRQINERLRTLIAAYRTLGSSFTGNLSVDPTHLHDLRRPRATVDGQVDAGSGEMDGSGFGSDRRRRIRDAVEAALSDIILLGTEEHVRLAGRAIEELVAGRQVHTQDLVVSLRNYIRKALDIEPVPADLVLPLQGPARPASSPPKNKGDGGSDENKGKGGGGAGRGGMGGGGAALGSGAENPASRTEIDEQASLNQSHPQ